MFKRKDLFAAVKSGCILSVVGAVLMMTSMLFGNNPHIYRVLHPTVSSSLIYLINNTRDLQYKFEIALAKMTGTRDEQIAL